MDFAEYRSRYFVQPEPGPRFALRGLSGAALTFRDFDRAVEFYSRVLGPPNYVEGGGTRGWRIGSGWLTLLAASASTEDRSPGSIDVRGQMELQIRQCDPEVRDQAVVGEP